MNDQQRQDGISEVLYEEIQCGKSQWWYLSFADDSGFLGGCIVNALGPTDAVLQAHKMGINPGGEVLSILIPDGAPLEDGWKNKLLSKQDMINLGMSPMQVGDEDQICDQ